MKRQTSYLIVALVCFGLGACHNPRFGHKAAPTGQVVATVGDQEITTRELQAALAGVNVTDPTQRKAAQQAALQQIIARKLMAKAARDQGLDKTPDFFLDREIMEENLLARALQSKVANSVPAPTSEEVNRYISDNPDMFEQRKIFDVDQVRFAMPANRKLLTQLQPLNTLEAIQAVLGAAGVRSERGSASLNAAGMDPRLVQAIIKLPAGQVFIMPASNSVLTANLVKGTRIVPLVGDDAVKLASVVLKSRHTQEAVQRETEAVLKGGAATVRFNKAYQPTPRAAAPANPAASASPAASSAESAAGVAH